MSLDDLDIFLQNDFYLSSLARFNSEGRQLILQYYNFALNNKILFRKQINLEEIEEFCQKNLKFNNNLQKIKESIIQDCVLTFPGSVPLNWSLGYLLRDMHT